MISHQDIIVFVYFDRRRRGDSNVQKFGVRRRKESNRDFLPRDSIKKFLQPIEMLDVFLVSLGSQAW
ncbi:hypothetical protein E2986_12352 [Frieseomelitta varia]|uniref:Uncharacterized protein n=1 Tax=Frieseomelitta varia TaxID=561572 RepID=A0A833RYH8_9HYME|nr:hypothetical protein E2986_12352 [Frieseomelitta varia]